MDRVNDEEGLSLNEIEFEGNNNFVLMAGLAIAVGFPVLLKGVFDYLKERQRIRAPKEI